MASPLQRNSSGVLLFAGIVALLKAQVKSVAHISFGALHEKVARRGDYVEEEVGFKHGFFP
ncbi:hypothetical protein GCM10009109_28520 [Marinobacterium sediminicola]